jgi:hypothetical protein
VCHHRLQRALQKASHLHLQLFVRLDETGHAERHGLLLGDGLQLESRLEAQVFREAPTVFARKVQQQAQHLHALLGGEQHGA